MSSSIVLVLVFVALVPVVLAAERPRTVSWDLSRLFEVPPMPNLTYYPTEWSAWGGCSAYPCGLGARFRYKRCHNDVRDCKKRDVSDCLLDRCPYPQEYSKYAVDLRVQPHLTGIEWLLIRSEVKRRIADQFQYYCQKNETVHLRCCSGVAIWRTNITEQFLDADDIIENSYYRDQLKSLFRVYLVLPTSYSIVNHPYCVLPDVTNATTLSTSTTTTDAAPTTAAARKKRDAENGRSIRAINASSSQDDIRMDEFVPIIPYKTFESKVAIEVLSQKVFLRNLQVYAKATLQKRISITFHNASAAWKESGVHSEMEEIPPWETYGTLVIVVSAVVGAVFILLLCGCILLACKRSLDRENEIPETGYEMFDLDDEYFQKGGFRAKSSRLQSRIGTARTPSSARQRNTPSEEMMPTVSRQTGTRTQETEC